MQSLLLALSLFTTLPLIAQSPADRFRAAEQQWLSHRPNGFTWDDGSPEAANALDVMWSAVTAEANNFLVAHPDSSPSELKTYLEQLTPVTDARFGNNLSASAVPLGEKLYLIAFTDWPASTVFVLRPQAGKPIAWRINDATAQGKDTENMLRAWQSSRADEHCHDREPHGMFFTCGPLTSSIGLLPPSSTGSPRFFVDAIYTKDAGAADANQLTIWEWEGSAPALLWIDRYIDHGEATRPPRIRGNSLSFGEQDEFLTFFACMSCDGRQLLHRVSVTPTGVRDLGTTVLYPELDRVDALFVALAKRQPTTGLAAPEVADALRQDVRRAAAKSAKASPNFISVGMLSDWSVTPGDKEEEHVCVVTSDLGRLDFGYVPNARGTGFFKSVERVTGPSKPCPKANAIHVPYLSADQASVLK